MVNGTVRQLGLKFLDCGGRYLGEFDPQMVANRNAEGRELFGARWPQVKVAMASLRRFNIWYADPLPGNINYGDD